MGLAASQGRLLLLTARKSDLEYRAQDISQQRLTLASELETVASEYARKTANRQMKLTRTVVQGQANQTQTVNLTYRNLMQYGIDEDGGTNSIYRIRNASGKLVVSSSTELPNNSEEAGYPNGNGNVSTVTVQNNGKQAIVSGTYNGQKIYEVYVVDSRLSDTSESENYFQEGLRNGRFIIEQRMLVDENGNLIGNDEADATTTMSEWNPISWSGMTEIQDTYYTDDDATAQAEYQTATARVQAQDKKLETDQKQIETQHKAVETEYESVQKVIQSNIESSFKAFS